MDAAILAVALAALLLSIFAIAVITRTRRTLGEVARVQFDDATLIAAGFKPPLANDAGTYEDPNLILASGNPTSPVPPTIPCPSTYVVYSSRGAFVPGCQGFGGPNDGNNPLVISARANAQNVAARIRCDTPCEKRIEEIWKGWDCRVQGAAALALAAVELKIFASGM